MKMINIFKPENNGWTLKNGIYDFHWFDGDQLPGFVSEQLEEQSGNLFSFLIFFVSLQFFRSSLFELFFTVEGNEDNADDDNDDLDIQYQDWLDDELSNFNDNDNEDQRYYLEMLRD